MNIEKIRPGGLQRCDYDTIALRLVQAQEGELLQCLFSSSPDHRMLFRGGAWEWVHAEATKHTKM